MAQWLETIVERIQQVFEPKALGEMTAQVLLSLVVGLIVLATFYILWRLVRILLVWAFRRAKLDSTTASFVDTLVKYGLMVIGVLTALEATGVATTPVLASVGIAGLTIGFAARDALSNIIAGILIFLDRPFTIDDLVEIQGVYGQVKQITLRSTRIVTKDGRMLAVPNSQIINNTVASYTNSPHLRLEIPVNVALDEDLANIRRILIGLVEGDQDYLSDPPPHVVVTQLNDFNVGIELRAWLDDERDHIEKRFELREKVFRALTAAGVVMPLETIQLAPFEARLKP